MEEYLDILDAAGGKTGIAKPYKEVHRAGLSHRAVHAWLLDSRGRLLLQKRSKSVQAYPGYWSVSAGGHVASGQTSVEAAQKETEEELGLSLPANSFQFLFSVKWHAVLNEGTHIDDEFQDVYLVRLGVPLSKLKSHPDEVEELKWIDADEFKKWVKEEREDLIPGSEEYARLLEYIKQRGGQVA